MSAPLAPRSLNREILRLAVPALGALIAEPVFLLIDGAMIGHLGVGPLAGLSIASAVLQTIVGLMIFLAYSTTPAVARLLGSGQPGRAVQAGVDGMWLAIGVGAVIAVAGWFTAPWLVSLFSPDEDVAGYATTYLQISFLAVPAMLVIFAATGLLRGMQDTTTPLWIAGSGFAANAALNYLLIYLLELGIAGAAIGSVIVQWSMVAVYALVIQRLARRHRAQFRPHPAGVRGAAHAGGWLLLRTLALRAAVLLSVVVATGLGRDELAGYQVVSTFFNSTALTLDALAIAAQALVGKGLGAGDVPMVRLVLKRCLTWGVGFGVVVGALVAALSGVIGLVFTGSAEIAALIQPAVLVLAIAHPLTGLVFVLDGVLIGAGDARYLALTGLVNLACYLPLAWWVSVSGVNGSGGLAWLAAALFLGYFAARGITLSLRARGTRWMVTGAA